MAVTSSCRTRRLASALSIRPSRRTGVSTRCIFCTSFVVRGACWRMLSMVVMVLKASIRSGVRGGGDVWDAMDVDNVLGRERMAESQYQPSFEILILEGTYRRRPWRLFEV